MSTITGHQDFHTSMAAPGAVSDPIETALELRTAGRLEQALEAISGPVEFSTKLYNLRGDLQFELCRIDEAAHSYAAVIEAEPGDTYAQHNLARCQLRQSRWEAAAVTLRKLLANDPKRDQVRMRLGECLLNLNRLEEALACFDQCWSEPVRVPALFGKAVVLQQLRRFDEAELTYERVLELDPTAGEALSNLIAMSMEVFDLRRIRRYATRLLAISPQSTIALQGLALVAIERREYDAAARHFSRLIDWASEGRVEDESDAIEYRLSRAVVEGLNTIRSAPLASPGRS